MQLAEARPRPCMAGGAAPRPRACHEAGLTSRNAPLQQRLRPSGRCLSGCQQQPGALGQQRRLSSSRLAASVVDGSQAQQEELEQQAADASSSAAAVAAAALPPAPRCDLQQAASAHSQAEQQQRQGEGLVRKPEDFQLPQGQLSYVERCEPQAAADVFRCAACTRPECQVGPLTMHGACPLTPRAGGHTISALSAARVPTCLGRRPAASPAQNRPSPRPPADSTRARTCWFVHTTPTAPCPPQTAAGCADMQWRSAPGGYLREVLTAKVYDVAVETPLEEAAKLRWGATGRGKPPAVGSPWGEASCRGQPLAGGEPFLAGGSLLWREGSLPAGPPGAHARGAPGGATYSATAEQRRRRRWQGSSEHRGGDCRRARRQRGLLLPGEPRMGGSSSRACGQAAGVAHAFPLTPTTHTHAHSHTPPHPHPTPGPAARRWAAPSC